MSTIPPWARPDEMNRTYAYLYNTFDSSLRSQMSADVWRLVFDYLPARRRHVNWANRHGTSYVRVHALADEVEKADDYQARLDELQRNTEGVDEETNRAMIERQQRAIDGLHHVIEQQRTLHFPPPVKTVDRSARMAFEVQRREALYCSVHAFNNLARSVILEPPDILSAIECSRTLKHPTATPEDVMLAALREGVFLLQIKLTDLDDTVPLATAPYLRSAHFASLLHAAGGMLVYQPSHGGTGHYVSLVLTPAGDWAIFDSLSLVVTRGYTAGDALNAYIADIGRVYVGAGQSPYDARAQVINQGSCEQHPFVGLLPISLACLWDEHAPENAQRLLVRTLVRRTLSVWHYDHAIDRHGEQDMMVPMPLSPCAIEENGWFIGYTPTRCRFTGLEVTNVASFGSLRYSIYRELNRYADDLAHSLLAGKFMECVPILKQTRSYMRVHWNLGCLFTGSDADLSPCDSSLQRAGSFTFSLMSNRRWFRLVVLDLVCTALIAQLTLDDEMTADTMAITTLFCLAAYHNAACYGSKMPHNVERLLVQLRKPTVRRARLPHDSLPKSLHDVVADDTDDLDLLVHFPIYDVSFWLLRSAQALQSFALSPRIVEEFAIYDDKPDDNHPEYDDRAELVRLLRTTLFQLPLAGADFGRVQRTLREQWAFETPELATHNRANLDLFFDCLHESTLALTPIDGETLVDVLAYDARYMDDQTVPCEVGDDDSKPRFIERAARGGFACIHRIAFGALALEDDRRTPAITNIDRLTLPKVPGQWRTARVRTERDQYLAVVPLAALVTDGCESPPVDLGDRWMNQKKRRIADVDE